MKYIFICFLLLLGSSNLLANNIEVSNISFNDATNKITFTLSWENSWTNTTNGFYTDAAWIWIKYAPNGSDSWYHANIVDSTAVTGYVQFISYDDLGVMIYSLSPTENNFGPVELTYELDNLNGGFQDFKVFATEMVYVDEGDYYAGDATSDGRFYQNGDTAQPLLVQSEAPLTRGNQPGQFNQEGSTSGNNISADFPKGWNSSFYMKYKITCKQYIDFLNCLQRGQQKNRIATDINGSNITNRYVMTNTSTVSDRNPIKIDQNVGTGPVRFYLDLDDDDIPNEENDGAHLPLNHITPEDINAYLDWCGLRPMTELEYEKICRGENMSPIAGEYAWGTDTYNDAGNILNDGQSNESTTAVGISVSLYKNTPLRCGYAATVISNRTAAGATFYGIQDIHNLGEYLIGVNSLNYKISSYGDGNVTIFGHADVSDWENDIEILSTENSSAPNPISQSKTSITVDHRSAYMGARGVRRVIL